MSNIIDSIQVSGTVYTLSAQTSGGGNPTVELTQAEYDALVTAGTVSADTYYIITDAEAGDLTNYYTKTETDNAITAATSTKQDTLVSGTNIKTINNTSILGSGNIDIQGGGGGKAVTGGTNISVTTGETADTINCTLPITANTAMFKSISIGSENSLGSGADASIIVGYRCGLNGDGSMVVGWNSSSNGDMSISLGRSTYSNSFSFAQGDHTSANKQNSFAAGYYVNANNLYEHSVGAYNVSNSGSTDADKTLFSVGNGTAGNARHNAFEIRQNGDIYLNDGTNDVKLQDYIQIKVVKLTQSAYDALSPNYDSNTLYIIKD